MIRPLKHGGARPGAGRHTRDKKPRVALSTTVKPATLRYIQRMAGSNGESIDEMVEFHREHAE